MTDDVWLLLKARAMEGKGRYAFPSPDDPGRPIGGVRKAHDAAVRHAYDLRHAYASRVVMAGLDLPTLAALLGHTSIQMTMRYVHPPEEHKREAVKKLETFKVSEAVKLAEKSQAASTISATLGEVN